MRNRKKEYRYRSGRCGVTRYSIERLPHLAKIGRVQYIRGYAYQHTGLTELQPRTVQPITVRLAVLVRGDRGYARYDGLCWGYGGEGPHGLRRLFEAVGIPEPIAKHIAHETESPDWSKVREFWRLTCSENFDKFEFRTYDADGNVVESTTYEIKATRNPVQKKLTLVG